MKIYLKKRGNIFTFISNINCKWNLTQAIINTISWDEISKYIVSFSIYNKYVNLCMHIQTECETLNSIVNKCSVYAQCANI